jgi:hypothetical protein
MVEHIRRISFANACLITISLTAFASVSQAGSLYGRWPNGPPQSSEFFPIAVWWQAPSAKGQSGDYATEAEAASAEHINIFLGISGAAGGVRSWPERFGQDDGELEAIKENHLYLIGGIATPSDENTSSASVSSMLALADSIDAAGTLIGYNAGDEPACGAPMSSAPTVVGRIHSFDPSRIVTFNFTSWMLHPQYQSCLQAAITALQSTSIASADIYPSTNSWASAFDFARSDFVSTPNDCVFRQGLLVQGLLHFAQPGQPVWAFVESGGDNFGFAEQNNKFKGSLTNGSDIVTNLSGWSRFTSTWLDLTLSGPGFAPETTITKIIDPTHALISSPVSSTSVAAQIKVSGGVHDSPCVERVNLCIIAGNEYRAVPQHVNAEVWMSIINGADGIEYFCHDKSSVSFCLGDAKGGAAATAVQANLTYINATILHFASVLNSETVGMCTMEQENFQTGAFSTANSCTGGIVAMVAKTSRVPGAILAKRFGEAVYVFAQPSRRSPNGGNFSIRLKGLGARSAKIVYDSNAHYDPAVSEEGRSILLDGEGEFHDTLGARNDDYQVKIYEIL